MFRVLLLAVAAILSAAGAVRAGLYYSAEQYASLPAQWRGFLLDQRTLRNIAVKPKVEADTSLLRKRYQEEAAKLQSRLAKEKLSADDLADLGAIYIRLGESDRAVEILRKAHDAHPNHFAIIANLGTAWQMLGEYRHAAASLEDAVRLAPGKLTSFEQAHLKLVRGRINKPAGELDDLFGIRYVQDKGAFEPGKLDPAELKKLPANAIAVTQQLALWLPADGPLLWQLGELANAHGDIRNAAAMMEGCVVQFGMQNAALRKRRQILRDAADKTPTLAVGAEHPEKHKSTIAFRSGRPLLSKLEALPLAPIDPKGVNAIPWELLGETTLEKPFKVRFPKYLNELEGKRVSLTGFMYPLRDDPDMVAFLFIESPVGCWYCEMPETTGILFVEMPRGETARYQRGLVRIEGQLRLNSNDPEDFLYAVKDARVGVVD